MQFRFLQAFEIHPEHTISRSGKLVNSSTVGGELLENTFGENPDEGQWLFTGPRTSRLSYA